MSHETKRLEADLLVEEKTELINKLMDSQKDEILEFYKQERGIC